jgi:hypothetical protein
VRRISRRVRFQGRPPFQKLVGVVGSCRSGTLGDVIKFPLPGIGGHAASSKISRGRMGPAHVVRGFFLSVTSGNLGVFLAHRLSFWFRLFMSAMNASKSPNGLAFAARKLTSGVVRAMGRSAASGPSSGET